MSGDVRRVSEEFLNLNLSAVYGRVYGLGSSEGASECSGLVLCSLLYFGKSLKGKVPFAFLKHQTTKTALSWVRQKKITICSPFGSPCSIDSTKVR